MTNIAIFDMDGTIMRGYSQSHFVRFLYKKKIIGPLFICKSYIWFLLYRLNLSNNVEGAMNALYGHFAGWEEREFNSLIDDFIDTNLKDKIFSDATGLIRRLKKTGYLIVLISAAICPIVARVKNYIGADFQLCTELEFKNNKISGYVLHHVNYSQARIHSYLNFIHSMKIKHTNIKVHLYTDHQSDSELLSLVDYPTVVNANKKLKKIALDNNWPSVVFTK